MTIDKLKELIGHYPADMKFSLRVGLSKYGRLICLILRPQYGLRDEIIYTPWPQSGQGQLSEEQVSALHERCHNQLLKHQKMLKKLGCLQEEQGMRP